MASLPCQDAHVIHVGLTGGIGSGKTEVARRLAVLGAHVIDADVFAREALAPGSRGEAAVIAAFGPEVTDESGHVDRGALSALVFRDAAALQRLEGIVHPEVAQRSRAAAAAAEPGAVVVHDVPLLVEKGLGERYDIVVVVDAPDEVRLERLVQVRGMDPDDARARMAAQATREARIAAADVVIDNGGSLADLDAQVQELWWELRDRLD
jgi:dephospho-CoA kinase